MDSTMNLKSYDNHVVNNNDDNESQFFSSIIFLFTLLHGKQLVFLLLTLDFAILLKCVLHQTCMHAYRCSYSCSLFVLIFEAIIKLHIL